jgi:3-phenylpropionate/trans-cinnamate dioxygenase ferredoxin component
MNDATSSTASTAGVRVARLEDIPEGEGIAIDKSVTGTADDIALLRDTDGSVWALDDTCTHEDASLADGFVEDGYVECPLHASRFCLKNGEVQGLPATRSACAHRVEVRDGEVYLYPDTTGGGA